MYMQPLWFEKLSAENDFFFAGHKMIRAIFRNRNFLVVTDNERVFDNHYVILLPNCIFHAHSPPPNMSTSARYNIAVCKNICILHDQKPGKYSTVCVPQPTSGIHRPLMVSHECSGGQEPWMKRPLDSHFMYSPQPVRYDVPLVQSWTRAMWKLLTFNKEFFYK